MAVRLSKGKSTETLSMTPLIDVIFLLLIFFVVTSEFEDDEKSRKDDALHRQEKQMPLNLPKASEVMAITDQPKQIYLNIDAEGDYYIDREKLTFKQVERRMRELVRDNPAGHSVIIRPDEKAPTGVFVAAINLCTRLEVSFSFAADEE